MLMLASTRQPASQSTLLNQAEALNVEPQYSASILWLNFHFMKSACLFGWGSRPPLASANP